MTRTALTVLALAALATPALAQPDVPPGGAPPPAPVGGTPEPTPPPDGTGPVATPPPTGPAMDDATRALIHDEVVKELAAERARSFDTKLGEKTPSLNNDFGEGDYLRGNDGFVDTRLNLTLVNENILVKPDETIPSIPGWRFGVPNSLGTQFFDNYDTRYSGYETLSHAVLYRNYRHDHLEVEGAFVTKINELSEKGINLSDDGSYMLISWWKDPEHKDPRRVSLTAFPVSSDRFRLGYSYRLSWGGNDEYRRVEGTPNSAIPGVKVHFDGGDHYAFLGAKSAVVLNHGNNDQEAKLSFLGGLGADLAKNLVRVELNGGYFDRGPNELQDVQDQEVKLYGASAQIALHQGMPVTSSLDYKLYKNDPERIGRVFQRPIYKPGLSWLVMSEATLLGQTLKDPEKTGSTKIQYGKAGDLNVRVMQDRWRFRFDLSYRDLAFIQHTVPSIPSYSDFPMQYTRTADLFGAIGVDKNWDDKYTVGVVVGVEKPATFTSPSSVPGDTSATSGNTTAVVRNNGQSTIITILPPGKDAVEQVAVKVSGQVNFGVVYAALFNAYYSYDGNQTTGTRGGPEGEFQFAFGQFNQIGMDVTLQAKF